jgi:SAM-dependent methyltransferase
MKDIKYYQLAGEASSSIGSHPGLRSIANLAHKSDNILDVGCGEGTRLNLFCGGARVGTGVDINSYAIKKAKSQYPQHKFLHIDSARLPFLSESFDLVYSAFVLEHTKKPDLFIREMIRVARRGGSIAILCPNYGAPNRRSPVSFANPLYKLISGFVLDLIPAWSAQIKFTQVVPRKKYINPDDDTTCEPYVLSLMKCLSRSSHVRLVQASSLWEVDDNVTSLHQKMFKFLGQLSVFPFKYFGPQLFVIYKKL